MTSSLLLPTIMLSLIERLYASDMEILATEIETLSAIYGDDALSEYNSVNKDNEDRTRLKVHIKWVLYDITSV